MTPTLSALRDAFLLWAKIHRRPKTVDGYKRYLDRFARAHAEIDLAHFKPIHLLTWGKTWHEIQAVQRLFSWGAKDAGLLERNPFATVKRPRPGQRKRILDRSTLARMMRAASSAFRAFLLAMDQSIARPQEIREVRWEELQSLHPTVDLRAALAAGQAAFVLDEFKAKDRRADPDAERVIPVTPRLGRHLLRKLNGYLIPVGPVFLNERGKPWTGNAVRCQMRTLRRRLGLAPDRRGENVVAYTLRHTSATTATAHGMPLFALQQIMGHADVTTTQRYQHLNVGHLVDALAEVAKRKRRRA